MRYFGGKQRTAKRLVDAMEDHIRGSSCWVEPFVGGASMASEVGKRFPDKRLLCSDANKALIRMWVALVNGWVPPEEVSREEYQDLMVSKNHNDPMTAFAGFGCSFAGKWFGGYAKSDGRNYAKNARGSLLKKLDGLSMAEFFDFDYRFAIYPPESVIYMDPPYAGTTGYGAVGDFDHEEFWAFCRSLSQTGLHVFVSEYSAPDDFEVFYETETKTDIRMRDGSKETRVEKLFVYKG